MNLALKGSGRSEDRMGDLIPHAIAYGGVARFRRRPSPRQRGTPGLALAALCTPLRGRVYSAARTLFDRVRGGGWRWTRGCSRSLRDG